MKKNKNIFFCYSNRIESIKKKCKNQFCTPASRFLFVLIMLFLLQMNVASAADPQPLKTIVTFELHNEPLRTGLDKLGKLAGYKMAYSLPLIVSYKNVTVPKGKRTLDETLGLLLANTNLTYVVKNNSILIIKKQQQSVMSADLSFSDNLQKMIQGKVMDNTGAVLAGVTVRIEDKNVGTTTDRDGHFSLNVEKDDALLFSFIGFASKRVIVATQDYLNITMSEAATSLNEVVVVSTGYQKLNKAVATGSFELVTAKDIEASPSVNIMQRLEGKVPGVRFDVRNNTVQIRGTSTYYGTSSPLIVIDGFPALNQSLADYPGTTISGTSGDSNNAILSAFNMADIESITFLKDAAATAIWGSKAANGVIVIETKKGREKKGPLSVNYNMTMSVSAPADLNNLNVMNSAQYVDLEKELFEHNYFADPTSFWKYANISEAQQYMFAAKRGEITDAKRDAKLDALSQKSNYGQIGKYLLQKAVSQQYNLSFSGGSDDMSYFVSTNYTDNAPVFKSNWAKAYSFTANITNDFFNRKLSVSAGINQTFTNTKVNNAAITAMSAGERGLRPYDMLVDEQGNSIDRSILFTPEVIQDFESKGYLPWTYNSMDELNYSDTRYNKNATRINASLTAKPLSWLSLNLSGIYQKSTNEKTNIDEVQSYEARDLINTGTTINNGVLTYGVPLGGIYKTSNDFFEDYSVRAQLDIDKSWRQINHLQFIAGTEIRQTQRKGYKQTRYGFDEDTQNSSAWNPTVPYTTVYGYSKTLGYFDGTIFSDKQRYLSYYSNASYSLMSKYYISASARFDDYSMIGVERSKRAKPFWSAGLKWNAKAEHFLSNVSWLSNLNMRFSYGTGGTVPISGTPFPLFSSTGKDVATNLIYGSISAPGNQRLGWETTKTTNEAIDVDLWQNRLNLTFELYQKKSYGLMTNVPFNSTYGWSNMVYNTGDLKSHGFDFKLSGDLLRSADWTWNASFNISYNTNKVTDNRYPDTSTTASSSSILTTGYPIDNLFLYRWAGLDDKGQSQIYDSEGNVLLSSDYPTLKAEDKYYAGRTTPSYFGGLSQSIRYKNFTLSLYASFAMGHKVLKNDINPSYYPSSGSSSGFLATSKALVNRWREPGDELKTNIPGIINSNFNSLNWYLLSDVSLISGDNIRMNQITLSYMLPVSLIKKLKVIRSLTLSGSVSNLGLLWTRNREGIDPDYIFSGDYSSLAPSKNYAFNLNVTF